MCIVHARAGAGADACDRLDREHRRGVFFGRKHRERRGRRARRLGLADDGRPASHERPSAADGCGRGRPSLGVIRRLASRAHPRRRQRRRRRNAGGGAHRGGGGHTPDDREVVSRFDGRIPRARPRGHHRPRAGGRAREPVGRGQARDDSASPRGSIQERRGRSPPLARRPCPQRGVHHGRVRRPVLARDRRQDRRPGHERGRPRREGRSTTRRT